MYTPHSQEEYDSALELRKKKGWGSTRIRRYLLQQGIDIGHGAIEGWIYRGKKPFKTRILSQIPKSSKKLTKEKAYVLGTLCGDGYISTGYRLGLEACDKEFVDCFQKCLERTYALNASRSERIRIKKCHYTMTLVSKLVVEDLKRYCDFYSSNWSVPKEVSEASKKKKSAFLRGFCDSEASVRYRKGACELSIYSANMRGIKELKQLLSGFGIRSRIIVPSTRTTAYISISDYQSLKSYYKDIGFAIKRKSDNLKKGLDSYKRKGVRRYSPSFKMNAMELLRKGRSHREVGRVLGTSYSNIYDWEKRLTRNDQELSERTREA